MLDLVDQLDEPFSLAPNFATPHQAKWPLAVDVLSIATATPEHKISQADALARVNRVTSLFARMSRIYTNSGIETRYSCVPPEFWPSCWSRGGDSIPTTSPARTGS